MFARNLLRQARRSIHNKPPSNLTEPLLVSPKPFHINKELLTPLAKHLSDTIRINGPISTAHFMRQALVHPLGGYYMKQDVFGQKGDFITSPEISQMFGELVGVFLVAQWQQMGRPARFNLVELGPGRGTLMADVLRTVTQFEAFMKGIGSVNLVEASPFLRGVQSRVLTGSEEEVEVVGNGKEGGGVDVSGGGEREGFQIHWHDGLESVERGVPMFLIAHEFFDAMPVYQFQMATDGWREVMVDLDEASTSPHNFCTILSPGKTKASVTLLQDERYKRFKEGSRIEVSPDSYTYAHQIGQRIREDGGFALVADYGKDLIMSDTMRGIQNHKFVSALSKPGDSDLTADVDFSFLAKAFREA
ncbi:hypothetical protein HDU98_012036, partial [Podochytrium sp. JEL0797]